MLKQGDRVRFTAQLGLTERVGATKFVGTVQPGDEGVYVGPVPADGALDWSGWHVIAVLGRVPGDVTKELYCPCHVSHFRSVPAQQEKGIVAEAFLGDPNTHRYDDE